MEGRLVLWKKVFEILKFIVAVYFICTLGLMLIPSDVDSGGAQAGLSFFEAFYVVCFTSLTVGFGEIPYQWNEFQRAWIIVVMFSSVATWIITLRRLQVLFSDPSVKHMLKRQRDKKRVESLKNDFL